MVIWNKGVRNAIWSLAVKTLKLRYRNSLLGVFWSMLNPLIFLAIMLAVFSQINQIENYALYALSGLVFWNFLSASVLQVLSSFIDNAPLLKSLHLPIISYPIAAVLAALFNLLLSLIPFSILLYFLGYRLDISIVALLPVMILSGVFILGLGLLLGTLNVYFRDVQLLWTSLLPAFFYFTPIVYTLEIVPKASIKFMKLNPFFYFMDCYHAIFYRMEFPNLTYLLVCLLLATISLGIGYYYFRKLKKGFISNI